MRELWQEYLKVMFFIICFLGYGALIALFSIGLCWLIFVR